MNGLLRDVTPEEIAQYKRDGVVKLAKILSPDWVSLVGEAVDEALYERREAVPVSYDVSETAAMLSQMGAAVLSDARASQLKDAGKFLSNVGAWMVIDKIHRMATQSPLGFLAAQLFETTKVNFYETQCFVKEPSAKEYTAFHTDEPYFHLRGDQCLTFWVSPDIVTSDSGAMKYVRGSHRWKQNFKPNGFAAQAPLDQLGITEAEPDQVPLPDIEGHPGDYDIVTYTSEPGDVIAHHYRTIHGSGPNYTANLRRRALALSYAGGDTSYYFRKSAPPQPHHKHALHNGDPLDSDQFPVVWRASPAHAGREKAR